MGKREVKMIRLRQLRDSYKNARIMSLAGWVVGVLVLIAIALGHVVLSPEIDLIIAILIMVYGAYQGSKANKLKKEMELLGAG